MASSVSLKKKATKKTSHADTKTPVVVKRKTYIEIMRIIAAFFVIVNHTSVDVFLSKSEPLSFTWFFSLTYFFLSKIAVPVFFMIMGGLLLNKIDKPRKSVERVVRMVIVAVLFSLVYYIKTNYNNAEALTVSAFLHKIITFRTANAYWYLYAYIGLLVVLPLMQRIAQAFSKKAIQYLIIISVGVFGIVPLIDIFFHIPIHHDFTDPLFPVHIGVVFLGYYIEKYMKIDKTTFFGAFLILISMISFQVLFTYNFYLENSQSFLMLDNWKYLTIVLSSVCFYIMFKYLSTVVSIKESVSKILCYLGSLTFGIYLLSDFMMELTRKMYNNLSTEINVLLAVFIWEITIFTLCAVTTAVMKFIPGLKKLL